MDCNERAHNPTFAKRLQELMQQHNPPMGIIDLSDAVQVSYETARRMVRGLAVPSCFIILAIANFFGADPAELEAVAKADRIRREFGVEIPLANFNPEVAVFNAAWRYLSEEQQTELLAVLLDYTI